MLHRWTVASTGRQRFVEGAARSRFGETRRKYVVEPACLKGVVVPPARQVPRGSASEKRVQGLSWDSIPFYYLWKIEI